MMINFRNRGIEKIGKRLKRVTSLILSLIMIAAMLPTSAYADNNYTGGGTGDEGYGTGVWRANWNSKQLGVRVSIVDQDGNLVLKDASTGKPYVVDILFSEPSGLTSGNIKYFYGNKFQDYTGVTDQGVKVISTWDLNSWMNNAIESNSALSHLPLLKTKDESNGTYTGLPVPIIYKNGSWKGNGTAVKEFFIDGSIGTFNSGSSGPSYNADTLYKPSVSGGNTGGSSSGTSSSGSQGGSKKIKTHISHRLRL